MRYIFDIETDGLIDDVTKIHCLVLKDVDNNKMINNLSVDEALDKLSKADEIIKNYEPCYQSSLRCSFLFLSSI